MDILYGTTMAAIFVLCLALLWTARRILGSSPLTSGELSLTRVQEAIGRNDFSPDPNFTDIEHFYCEPEVDEISPSLIDPLALEMMASDAMVADPIETAAEAPDVTTMNLQPMEIHAMEADTIKQIAASEEIPAQPVATCGAWIAKHLPRAHNYWLECLLLGVSVVVLVQTQRSASRHRSLHSTDQVA